MGCLVTVNQSQPSKAKLDIQFNLYLIALLFLGFGGGKYISFEDRQWHQPCFTCSQCSVTLVGAGFFPDGDRILCRDCHNNL